MKHIISALCAVAIVCFAASAQDEYMDADLRGQVDALKNDASTQRTNQQNIRPRMAVLWDWMNAYAMTGRHIQPNATASLNQALAVPVRQRNTPGQLRTIDDLIVDFTYRDENPDGIGKAVVSPSGPFKAETWQTIEVTYTVAKRSIEKGGQILIGRQFQSDAGRWQHRAPEADNFISIRANKSGIEFTPSTAPIRGMHGGFRGAAPQLAFDVSDGSLTQGDTFTITYGDRSQGGKGYQVETYTNDAMALPLYIKFDRDSIYFFIDLPTYEVEGKDAHTVHGFVPSVVKPGEPFDMSVRVEDEYYGRATGTIPDIEIKLNGKKIKTLSGTDGALQVVADLTISDPGIYRYTLSAVDGTFEEISDPIWVDANPTHRIYWGETHGHCGFAEGQGTPDSYFEFGRDDADLDFLTLSEHDIWMDDYEWKFINDAVARFSKEGKFILFPGYEWTSRRDRGGHHNVFFRRAGMDRVPNQEAPRSSDLYFGLKSKHDPKDVLIIPHAHQAADWRNTDIHMEHLVEIMSAHGTFEWFGNKYLEHGRQVGFISASDDHLSHPGYTSGSRRGFKQRGGLAAVNAPELTTDTIFDALRNRQAYATSGERMILAATMNGEAMGTRQTYTETRVVEGQVMGTASIATVELIKNGDVIRTLDYSVTELSSHAFIQVNMDSDSVVFTRDNPRGSRPWYGSLEVTGAKLIGVESPSFQNTRIEKAEIDADNPNVIDFVTTTRGRINNMVLELDGVSDDTVISVHLDQGLESGTAPVRIRQFANIPAADVNFTFSDFEGGEIHHDFQVDVHTDTLSLKIIDPESPMDQTFSINDTTDPAYGDYYYVRVRQTDGALAWSSPFWIGGEPTP
jgi:hypothetical protein